MFRKNASEATSSRLLKRKQTIPTLNTFVSYDGKDVDDSLFFDPSPQLTQCYENSTKAFRDAFFPSNDPEGIEQEIGNAVEGIMKDFKDSDDWTSSLNMRTMELIDGRCCSPGALALTEEGQQHGKTVVIADPKPMSDTPYRLSDWRKEQERKRLLKEQIVAHIEKQSSSRSLAKQSSTRSLRKQGSTRSLKQQLQDVSEDPSTQKTGPLQRLRAATRKSPKQSKKQLQLAQAKERWKLQSREYREQRYYDKLRKAQLEKQREREAEATNDMAFPPKLMLSGEDMSIASGFGIEVLKDKDAFHPSLVALDMVDDETIVQSNASRNLMAHGPHQVQVQRRRPCTQDHTKHRLEQLRKAQLEQRERDRKSQDKLRPNLMICVKDRSFASGLDIEVQDDCGPSFAPFNPVDEDSSPRYSNTGTSGRQLERMRNASIMKKRSQEKLRPNLVISVKDRSSMSGCDIEVQDDCDPLFYKSGRQMKRMSGAAFIPEQHNQEPEQRETDASRQDELRPNLMISVKERSSASRCDIEVQNDPEPAPGPLALLNRDFRLLWSSDTGQQENQMSGRSLMADLRKHGSAEYREKLQMKGEKSRAKGRKAS